MNSEKNKGRFGALLVLALFTGLTIFSSCKKSGPSIGDVSVVDSAGRPVASASVTLWQDTAVNQTNNVQSTIRVTKQTDGSGKASFEFSLQAYLNITVIKGTDTAKSFIRLKEHETVEKTVVL
jgi:hypothetical protein